MASFTSTQVGSSADYLKYLADKPKKTDRVNDPDLLDFSLSPSGVSFVKLTRGSYITLNTSRYPNWFTGYITNEPDLTILGKDHSGVAQWGYKYHASGDDYIFNLYPLGVQPEFINTTQGAILKALIASLTPSITWNVTGVQAGLVVARYAVDPTKKFGDIVKEFAEAAQYRWAAKNHVLTYMPKDSVPQALVIDGNDQHFTPKRLTIGLSKEAYVNDATVVGDVEPQGFITEYFVGNDAQGEFPLTHGAYGVAPDLYLDDDFSASSIDTSKWSVFDQANNWLKPAFGVLNVLGGPNDGLMNEVYLASVNAIPLEGNVRCTHGEYDFVNSASRGLNGIVASLWTTSAPTSSLAGCLFGIRVHNQTNMVPDSDNIFGTNFWNYSAAGTLASSSGVGVVRGNGWKYIGTGAAAGNLYVQSPAITVVPLSTYTVSGYIDATHATAAGNGIYWAVFNTGISTQYAGAVQPIGSSGRVSATFTVPAGVTQVKVIFDVHNCTVTSGATLIASDPQLELNSVATPYETNNVGAMDTRLMPICNGAIDYTQYISLADFNKTYVMRTVVGFANAYRLQQQYAYLSKLGVVGAYGGQQFSDTAYFQTLITALDRTTGIIQWQRVWTNSCPVSSTLLNAIYMPVIANDLHCTLTGVTISKPLQAALDLKSFLNPEYMISGSGTGFADPFDQFQFASQSMTGDHSVSTRVLGITNTSANAAGGVMMRQSLTSTSNYVAVIMTYGNGPTMIWRSAGVTTSQPFTFGNTGTPAYVKLTRVGNVFTGYFSLDGINWTAPPAWTVTQTLTNPVLSGLCVSGANATVSCEVDFDFVKVGTGAVSLLGVDLGGSLIPGFTQNTANWTRKIIGQNEIDSLDGQAPVATITQSGNGPTARTTLGSLQYNPGNATLAFFSNKAQNTTDVPRAGDMLRLRYRSAGISVARVRDDLSIANEALAWGDGGLRSSTRSDLTPLPRTSDECEAAAAALVAEYGYPHYEGSYSHYAGFSFTSEPLAGSVLKFQNLSATAFPSIQAEAVTQVVSTLLSVEKTPELFQHDITFGRNDQFGRVQSVLSGFSKKTDPALPVDPADVPASIASTAVGLTTVPPVLTPELVSFDANNYNFNTNQLPPAISPNVVLFTEQFDNAVWAQSGGTTITASATTDPLGGTTADQINFATKAANVTDGIAQIISVNPNGFTWTASIWLMCATGTQTVEFLAEDTPFAHSFGSRQCAVTTSWQRFTFTFTPPAGSNPAIKLWIRAPFSTALSAYSTFAWGAQLEVGSAPTAYVSQAGSYVIQGGFEVRYSDESWGADTAKNLAGRFSTQTFSVPRNRRGTLVYMRPYDTRNQIPTSEDLTTGWILDGCTAANAAALNPDGDVSSISTLTPVSGNKQARLHLSIPAALSNGVVSASVKGTAGDTMTLLITNNLLQSVGTTVTLTGAWQRVHVSNSFTAVSGSPDKLSAIIQLNAQPLQVTRLSFELNTLNETVYCKTSGSAYGALSRFSSGVYIGLPQIPEAPSATFTLTDVKNPVVNLVLPAEQADVWGYEIRASDNSTVLEHVTVEDPDFNLPWTLANNTSRTPSVYLYTFNLLNEYSVGYNLTATIATPAASGLTIDDSSKLLFWTETNTAVAYQVDMDATDATMTHIALSWTVATPSLLLSDPIFFNQRWFRVTPIDTLGNGTPSGVLSHVYTPTGVVEFNGNEVAVIPAPTTPTTDPVVPAPLSDYPRDVIDNGWSNYKNNRLRYF